MKIFIVGCAKTGTTLVQRLFSYFKNVEVEAAEGSLEHLILLDDSKKHQVVKRDCDSIFSCINPEPSVREQSEMIMEHKIRVVYVFRNREDTLRSSNQYVSPQRYDACMYQYHDYKYLVSCLIGYYILVAQPDQLQCEIGRLLGLGIRRRWSTYPKNLPNHLKELFKGEKEYKLRPIGEPV
jgi:hypothetical protein